MSKSHKKLSLEEMQSRLPVTEAELKDLTQKAVQFQSTLSPNQLELLNIAVSPIQTQFKKTTSFSPEEISALFGDTTTHEDLQKFLTASAGLTSEQAMHPVGYCISITVSLFFEC